jgi:glycosyltransferase involved in cell wall biosynthesis
MIPNPLPFRCEQDPKPKSGNTMLYCGRIHPEKGLHLLVNAFRDLGSKWSLRLVGPWQIDQGGGGESYLSELRNLGGDSNVAFVGPIYDEERLFSEYRNARIFIYPSVAERGETFGLAPLEAMAFGCVPVVSSLECFQDFITDGENGLIFDHRCGDASSSLKTKLMDLLESSETMNRLSRNACNVQISHSSTSIAKLFLSDFQTVVDAANE